MVDDPSVVAQLKLKFGLREEVLNIVQGDSEETLSNRIMEVFGLGFEYTGLIN